MTDCPLHVQELDEGSVLLLFSGQTKHIPLLKKCPGRQPGITIARFGKRSSL